MARPSKSGPTWSDAQLAKAVAVSRSWRGVIRELGLDVTSAGPVQAVRRQATQLGLDTSHFTGQRTWSDAKLVQAAPQARSWSALLAALDINPRPGPTKPVSRLTPYASEWISAISMADPRKLAVSPGQNRLWRICEMRRRCSPRAGSHCAASVQPFQ